MNQEIEKYSNELFEKINSLIENSRRKLQLQQIRNWLICIGLQAKI